MRKILTFLLLLLPAVLRAADDHFMFFVMADVQVYEVKELDYVRRAAADMKAEAAGSGVECFAFHLGDILGEYYQDAPTFGDVSEALEESGLKFHHILGNHDLFHNAPTLDGRKDAFRKEFGPTRYSFDKGGVHFIVFDDVFPIGRNWQVIGFIGDEQMEWIREDLSKVAPGSTVVLCSHIPTYSREARAGKTGSEELNKIVTDRQALYSLLKPFNAHILTGHEHYAENYVIRDGLMEHVHTSLSGLFWQSLLNSDGTPWGYYIYEVKDGELSWRFKAVERPADEQFTYYAVGEDPHKPESVVVNVWNYDPQWKVEWYEDDVLMGEMTRFSGWDRSIVSDVEARRETEFKWKYIGAGQTEHLFYATPKSASSRIRVVVTDRFGNKYSK